MNIFFYCMLLISTNCSYFDIKRQIDKVFLCEKNIQKKHKLFIQSS